MELIALQAVVGIVIGKNARGRIQAVQAISRGNPQAAVHRLQDGIHHIVGKAVHLGIDGCRAAVAVADGKPFAGPYPDTAVGSLQETVHAGLGGNVTYIIGEQFPLGMVIAQGAVESSHPDNAGTVYVQSTYPLVDVFRNPFDHLLPGNRYNAHTGAVGAHIKEVFLRFVGHAGQVGSTQRRRIGKMPETAGRCVAEQAVQVSGNPQRAVLVKPKGRHRIVGEGAVGGVEDGAGAVGGYAHQSPAVRSHPQGAVPGVPGHGGYASIVGPDQIKPVHGARNYQNTCLVCPYPNIALVVFQEGMHLPAGEVLGNRGDIGLPDGVFTHIIHVEAPAFRAHQEGPLPRPLMGFVVKEGNRLAAAGIRVPRRQNGMGRCIINVQSSHRSDEDISPGGLLGKIPDIGLRVQADLLVLQGGAVHHRQAAGFPGNPHPPAGILEQGENERGREVAVQKGPPAAFERMGFRINDIDAVLGSGHPKLRGAVPYSYFQDGRYMLGGTGRLGVLQIHIRKTAGFRVEGLEAHGCTGPQGSPAVLKHGQHQVAGQGIPPVPAVVERKEIPAVKTGQAVFRRNPDKAAGVLVDIVYLGIGEVVVRCIEAGPLRLHRIER